MTYFFAPNLKTNFSLLICLIILLPVYSSGLNNKDTLQINSDKPLRIYNTARLTTKKPVIDGVLNDSCWNTGEWSGDFTQWIPNEGAKPTYPTWIKILYDDKNIYVAIRSVDREPEKISRKAGRRDEFNGDAAGINFDSYHDKRTGFEFNVTAAGQKIDLLLTNPMSADYNWNAVWSAKTGLEDSAWVAEYEIPLSQLRYSNDPEQVWGMHCWRWIDRLQEESDWELQSSTGPGMLYLFGEIHGIKDLPKSRRIEIMPYALGRLKTYPKESENPFADKGKTWSGKAGLDAKIGLSSNFTADVTINPDFGQVESDPSEMNLTAFETFYDEKRPFFLEGKNIFDFEFDGTNLFYSRRIGHTPGYYPDLGDNEYIDFPDNTAIIEAVKLSGKTSKGLSIGIMQSISANEKAKVDSVGNSKRLDVDPMTNYSIIRVLKDFKQGNTMFGGMLTSTNRFINEPYLNSMNRNAYTGGIDLLHQWRDKEYYVDAKIVGSYIDGHENAIRELQNASARYYNRPGADYLNYDTTLTHLSGYGGKIKIGKGSKGFWRYSTEFDWRSSGLDLNDIGFMQTADIIKQINSLYYFITKPVSIFRTYNFSLNQTNNWDFGLNHLSSGADMGIYLEFVNKWAINTTTYYTMQSRDNYILRGGEAMLVPAVWENSFYARTDPSKRVYLDCSTDVKLSGNNSSEYYMIKPSLSVRPVNTLKVSFSVEYATFMNELQYIDTKVMDNENRYVLGRIDQKTMVGTFRIDYNITPEISIQYYGSPFATAGTYSEFKSVTNPRDEEYTKRFSMLNPVLIDDTYEVSENNNAQVDYTFDNPDFNFSQFRSNLVFRWEYRPGSQLYIVWSQDRTQFTQPGSSNTNETMGDLRNIFPNNIFLIKLNYWFSI